MRCNYKTACFAVTPRKKAVGSLNITKIWQLRRREKTVSVQSVFQSNHKAKAAKR